MTTIEEARLQKAREIATKANPVWDYSNGGTDWAPVVITALAALVEANWQPPEDPDIAAAKACLPPYLILQDSAAVFRRAKEIALAAYKAGRAAR
jgi:hypothetical protein